jgi:hypothetical protein
MKKYMWYIPASTSNVIEELVMSSSGAVSALQMQGQVINNYGQTGDVALTLAPATKGANFTVILGTTVAKYFRLDPDAGDKIYIDGTADSDGHYIGIASAVAGAALQFRAFQTGASSYDWYVSVISGAWLME